MIHYKSLLIQPHAGANEAGNRNNTWDEIISQQTAGKYEMKWNQVQEKVFFF